MEVGQILSQEVEPSNLKERLGRFVSKISFWKKLDRNQQFSLIAVLAFVLILPIATFVALEPTRPFSRAQFPATPPITPPPPGDLNTITVLEKRDDDGAIGARKCGGSPCENSLVIYPVGDGQFRFVESVNIEMHDHFRSLKYSFYVRDGSGNWTKLVDRADVKTGADNKLCKSNKIANRKHPPGTQGDDACFRNYNIPIGREIDSAKIELSGSNHHLHIKNITWSVKEVVVNCKTDSDCQKYEYCYQPPMPPCPAGAACVQVLPPKYCRVRPTPTATPTPTRSPAPTNTPTPTPQL